MSWHVWALAIRPFSHELFLMYNAVGMSRFPRVFNQIQEFMRLSNRIYGFHWPVVVLASCIELCFIVYCICHAQCKLKKMSGGLFVLLICFLCCFLSDSFLWCFWLSNM